MSSIEKFLEKMLLVELPIEGLITAFVLTSIYAIVTVWYNNKKTKAKRKKVKVKEFIFFFTFYAFAVDLLLLTIVYGWISLSTSNLGKSITEHYYFVLFFVNFMLIISTIQRLTGVKTKDNIMSPVLRYASKVLAAKLPDNKKMQEVLEDSKGSEEENKK